MCVSKDEQDKESLLLETALNSASSGRAIEILKIGVIASNRRLRSNPASKFKQYSLYGLNFFWIASQARNDAKPLLPNGFL